MIVCGLFDLTKNKKRCILRLVIWGSVLLVLGIISSTFFWADSPQKKAPSSKINWTQVEENEATAVEQEMQSLSNFSQIHESTQAIANIFVMGFTQEQAYINLIERHKLPYIISVDPNTDRINYVWPYSKLFIRNPYVMGTRFNDFWNEVKTSDSLVTLSYSAYFGFEGNWFSVFNHLRAKFLSLMKTYTPSNKYYQVYNSEQELAKLKLQGVIFKPTQTDFFDFVNQWEYACRVNNLYQFYPSEVLNHLDDKGKIDNESLIRTVIHRELTATQVSYFRFCNNIMILKSLALSPDFNRKLSDQIVYEYVAKWID